MWEIRRTHQTPRALLRRLGRNTLARITGFGAGVQLKTNPGGLGFQPIHSLARAFILARGAVGSCGPSYSSEIQPG